MANNSRGEHEVDRLEGEDTGFNAPPMVEDATDHEDASKPKSKLEELAERLRTPAPVTREQKSGDRIRGAVILAATTIGCVFLFFGLFTTEVDPSRKERRTQPSLGRPQAPAAAPTDAGVRSIVPQLNVTQQPNDETGELTEKDLLGTMRNRGTSVPVENPPKPIAPKAPVQQQPLSAVNFEDPALAEAYRRRGLTPPPQRRTEVTEWMAPETAARPPAPSPALANPNESLRKSSFVFVRANAAAAAVTPAVSRASRVTQLLPQGSKLVARLQHAVSSAAKVPVVAVIEYNYERDGVTVIPAGTKAYGVLAQAAPQGWVTIKFDALEFPSGDQEKINGTAIGMDQGVLRGFVNGRNTGKKFLTRTLTGIGTIAAFAAGGRGLGGQIDNSILLRERLSSNIAMAGEQELAMLAYRQNIVVTVPANTRFLLVLNEAGIGAELPSVPASSTTGSRAATVSPQEMQELMAIRNEMREMSRILRLQNQSVAPPAEPEK